MLNHNRWLLAGMTAALMLSLPSLTWAEGTETLGHAELNLAAGTGIVGAGIGLETAQPRDLTIDVPAGAEVVQVILHWSHETVLPNGDDTLTVNGNEVDGTEIGGPAFFFNFGGNQVFVYGYRADITDLDVVSAGTNVLTIGGLETQVSSPGTGAHGAGVIVVLDDGTELAELALADGVDLAYCGFDEPRRSTVPQTFSITPASVERVANLLLHVGSVGTDDPVRPNEIRVSYDVGAPVSFFDEISAEERLFDTQSIGIPVPAGASEITVSVQSNNASGTCPLEGLRNASLTWLAAALSVPTAPVVDCEIEVEKYCEIVTHDMWGHRESTGLQTDCSVELKEKKTRHYGKKKHHYGSKKKWRGKSGKRHGKSSRRASKRRGGNHHRWGHHGSSHHTGYTGGHCGGGDDNHTAGIEVIYHYQITNLGEGDVYDVTAHDDQLGDVEGAPIDVILPLETVTLTEETTIDATVTNTVLVEATNSAGQSCEAEASTTVTVNRH